METELIKFIAAIFVITNPLGAVPLFLSLTKEYTSKERRRAAWLASLTVAIILSVNVLVGDVILDFFGISIAAFQVGGGIIILLLAISMLHARQSPMKHTREEGKEANEKDSIGVVPLGIPLLAGPGAISTVIVFAHRNAGWFNHLSMIGVCIVLALCVWVALRLAERIGNLLGRTGINIVTRLMGLILAAVAVQFISDGVHSLWNTHPSPAAAVSQRLLSLDDTATVCRHFAALTHVQDICPLWTPSACDEESVHVRNHGLNARAGRASRNLFCQPIVNACKHFRPKGHNQTE